MVIGVRMTLVVKRVKGRLYVYEQYRVGGEVATIYIGPLEEIVRTYQALKSGIRVNYKLTRKEIRKIADYISKRVIEAVVNSTRSAKKSPTESTTNLWCGGWDLNPRRPTPSGPQPDPFDQARAPPHLTVFFSYIC